MMTFANPNVAGLPCDPTKQMVGMIYYVNVNGSGNNDPDGDSGPRMNRARRRALLSDAKVKRLVRDTAVRLGNEVYVDRDADLTERQKQMGPDLVARCLDVRLFGGVLTQKLTRFGGRVRGPVQVGYGVTTEDVVIKSFRGTRVSGGATVEHGEDDPSTASDLRGTMCQYKYIEFCVYAVPIFFNPFDAAAIGTTSADLGVMYEGLIDGPEYDRSARRSQFACAGIVMFTGPKRGAEHANITQNRVSFVREDDAPELSSFRVAVNTDGLAERGMECFQKWFFDRVPSHEALAAK